MKTSPLRSDITGSKPEFSQDSPASAGCAVTGAGENTFGRPPLLAEAQ